MKINVGPVDSVIRILIGTSLLFITLMGYVGAWGYLSIILVATGLGRTSPLYLLLNINSNRSGQGITNVGH
jgi:hypothetical protein